MSDGRARATISTQSKKPILDPGTQLFLGHALGELTVDLIVRVHNALLVGGHVGVFDGRPF
jgi:hypothetical protein